MKQILLLLIAALCAASRSIFGGGVVTNCTQADFQSALAGGGLIVFQCDGVLTLTNTVSIRNSVTLDASGHRVKISGGGLVRLFSVSGNAVFAATNLTFADGADIRTNEVLDGEAFPARGGAILSVGGTLNLFDCSFTNNVVKGANAQRRGVPPFPAAADAALGGAIFLSGGGLTLSNCVFSTNTAAGGGAEARAGVARGGALYLENSAAVIIRSFFHGSASQGGEAFDALGVSGFGGDAEGSAIYSTNTTLAIRDSDFEANTSFAGKADWIATAGTGRGGAIRIDNGSQVTVDACRFIANQASGGGVPRFAYGGDGLGGAIAASGGVTITRSTFSLNVSRGGRSFSPGVGAGGAVWSTNKIVLSACTLFQNIANGGDGYTMPATSEDPSAEENVGKGGALALAGEASITNCTLAENQAIGGNNPSIFSSNPAQGLGGAICLENCKATVEHLSASLNTAWTGLTFNSTRMPGLGAGLFVANSALATNALVNVGNSIFAWNTNGNAEGGIIDLGYNISSDSTPAWSSPESRNNIDPLLEALSDNGGPTLTMALLAGSPARDIIPSDETSVDQRGTLRPQGPGADSGAFEADYAVSAPVLLRQPSGATVRVGSTFTLTGVAAGTGPLSYVWRKDGLPMAAPHNASITLSNIQPADAGSYTLVVSNSLGSSVSDPALLIVDATPLILSQPQSILSAPGADENFSVSAEGPSLEFQWWHDSLPQPGATNALLRIVSAVGGDQGSYFAVISNFAGSVTSAVATLAFDESALKILEQPQGETLEEGRSVSFSVLVSGVAPITYQWLKNGEKIEGATQPAFTISRAQFQDAGTYSVIVSNDYRAVRSAEAQLTIVSGAASPRLTISRVNAQSPSMAITFPVEAARTYHFLQSTNLASWSVLDSKTAASTGSFQFIVPMNQQAKAFFKITTP